MSSENLNANTEIEANDKKLTNIQIFTDTNVDEDNEDVISDVMIIKTFLFMLSIITANLSY